jgi:dCMP deaminase
MHTRPQLHSLFMSFALLLSQRSECSRSSIYAKNGAVITAPDKRSIIGFGYNGRQRDPNHLDECPGDSNGVGNCGCLHAEINALVNAGSCITGCIMYATTMPCNQCARAIVNAGISGLYYHKPYRNMEGYKILLRSKVWTCPLSSEDILPISESFLENLKGGFGFAILKPQDLSSGEETIATPSK